MVTAHNEILPFSSLSPDGRLVFGPLASPSRPILYSANLCLGAPGEVLVAGGTVFGEIVVWKYRYHEHADGGSHSGGLPAPAWEVLYVFTGHEGSVFGVRFSDEFVTAGPGGKRRLLVSCSDDRTVRVWDVSEECASAAVADGVEQGRELDGARETGFGGSSNSEVKRENEGDKARCVAVAMGHVSRIWGVGFGRVDLGGRVEVFSFGEDCSRQRWELEVDWAAGRAGVLRHCGASTCHAGKNIWSAAILGRGEREPLIATGGADGGIVVSGKVGGAGSGRDAYEDLDLSLTLEEMFRSVQGKTQSTPSAEAKKTKHTFQRYAFLSDTVMATTVSGRLFLATMGENLVWEEAPLDEAVVADLRTYNVVKSPARDTALLGSPSGKVYLFRRGEGVRELACLPGKISDIILLNHPSSRTADSKPWSIVINVLGFDHAVLLHFDPSSGITTVDPRKIKLPEHYIATAAAFCNTTLILGSRTGSLTVYTTDPDTYDFTPLASRKDCKTKDAITSIVPIPGTNASSFLTTCRDGKCRIYTLPAGAPYPSLQHEIAPPLNTLEAAFFTAETKSQLILHGFRGPNFLAYNDSTRAILASIPCGGAHRPFATVSPPQDPGQLRFVCSKARDLRIVSQSGEGERVLRPGGHGREIKAVASSFSSSSNQHLLATAAEDTTIRIWKHSPDNNKTTCLALLQGHSAGIQTLRFFTTPESTYLLSSAGSEELFVWRLAPLTAPPPSPYPSPPSSTDSKYDVLAVVREAVWGDFTPDRDLRIVDFDVMAYPVLSSTPDATTTGAATTDTSANNTTTLGGSSDGEESEESNSKTAMLITLALSDSTLRIYTYTPTLGFSTLRASAHYTGACPTQVRYLQTDNGVVDILTAFTDGHVAVWRMSANVSTLNLLLTVRVHQSSIKSLDITTNVPDNTRWTVVTGGDDNALGFLEFTLEKEKNEEKNGGYTVLGRYRVRDAHAAGVTGVGVVNNNNGGEEKGIEVVSVGNDQRVKLWRAERRHGGVGVVLVDSRYSAVADAGDLEVVSPRGRVVVGGVGMEVWDVQRG